MVRDTPTPGEPRVARVTRSYLTRDQPGVSTGNRSQRKLQDLMLLKGFFVRTNTFIGCYVKHETFLSVVKVTDR